ncbi:hypothetical protein N7457_004959 [Penicillium paradoxum]|uniref:uncharacterized protein n=1 Tax=Penicillium paradoxum TaxID=176176 RepID=UPI0025471B98|nr:uncharacterized protein N7457_004959 [Penicillium paradoxum]KAJ5783185.1 hypothetical protein N7457_004959 [Penicillium paradoxum]
MRDALPTISRRIRCSFSLETTSRIITVCKSRGLTVTAAIHAALVVAVLPYAERDFIPETRGQGGGNYTGFNVIDLRKYVPAPFNGPETAVSVYHTVIPTSIASSIQKVYSRDLSKDEPRNIFKLLAEYVGKVLDLLNTQPDDPLHAPAHPELSSIGIIIDHPQAQHEGAAMNIEVEEWWVAVGH